MQVLIFGDSITAGQYDSRGGWANRLIADQFAKKQHSPDKEITYIYNLGIGGDTMRKVIDRMMSELAARRWSDETEFALVFAVGINDTLEYPDSSPVSTPKRYGQELRYLYELAHEITHKILFVGLTPVEDEKFDHELYHSQRIGDFETVLRAFATEKKVPFVPVFETFLQAMGAGQELFVDGLHPNDAGHELLCREIKPVLEALLTTDDTPQ